MVEILLWVAVLAQDPVKATEPREFRGKDGGTLNYRFFEPNGADSGKRFPGLC